MLQGKLKKISLLYVCTSDFVRTFTDKMRSLAPYPNPVTTKFLTLALRLGYF